MFFGVDAGEAGMVGAPDAAFVVVVTGLHPWIYTGIGGAPEAVLVVPAVAAPCVTATPATAVATAAAAAACPDTLPESPPPPLPPPLPGERDVPVLITGAEIDSSSPPSAQEAVKSKSG